MKRINNSKGQPCLWPPGVSFGYGRDAIPRIISESDTHVLVSEPGVLYWAGRGQTKYYCPSFTLLKKLGLKDEGYELMEQIEELKYNRSTRKETLIVMKKKFEELSDESGRTDKDQNVGSPAPHETPVP